MSAERMTVRLAASRADVLRCQYLIAETYNKEYEVVFSDDRYDLDAKVEPWPHRYLMGLVGGELVATSGLYLKETYVERFGNVTDEEVDALIRAAGARENYRATRKREITKVVVGRQFRGRGYGRFFLACAHSSAFLQVDADAPHVLVCCARKSIWDNMWHGAGVTTRPIKPFPYYKVHELYRSEADPMDSRLVIPDLDVPARFRDLAVPGEYEVEKLRSPR